MEQTGGTDVAEVSQWITAAESLGLEIARRRARLRHVWQSGTAAVNLASAMLAPVRAERESRDAQLRQIADEFGAHPDAESARRTADGLGPPAADRWLRPTPNGGWTMEPKIRSALESDLVTAQGKLREARARTFGRSYRLEAETVLTRFSAGLRRLHMLQSTLEAAQAKAMTDLTRAANAERVTADGALRAAGALAQIGLGKLPAPLQPWDSPAWREWAARPPVPGLDQVYAGSLIPVDDADLGDHAAFGSGASVPLFLSLRQNLELAYTESRRDAAFSLARSLLLRRLAALHPGDMQFCFYDPVGLGQSVGEFLSLAEYVPELIGGKAWSSTPDLLTRLAEQTAHIEQVIQKYLRTTYQTIDDFNAAAGEIAEPYRYLVLFDFPAGFTEEAMSRLAGILRNGPRCGVHTLLLTNAGVTPGYGVNVGQIAGSTHRINLDASFVREQDGYRLQLRLAPEGAVPGETAHGIIDAVGRQVARQADGAVSFDKAFRLFTDVARRGIRTDLSAEAASTVADDEATWWRDDSTRGLLAPIGQKGARDAAILSFDSGDRAGALLVGRPGSGKSTLLHTLIAGLATLYSPAELELYLIDFKEGVEFKAYATEGLPHARMVAIESDREFGLSVLQSLEAEMSRRGQLLRATGGRHSGLRGLREASGEALPRVLLVFDEFQVLFARNDKLGLAAAGLLETIIRQGRGFGIHVLLGSQSLSGLDALGSHVPQLLSTRILLPATEADARKVLADGNDAGQYLTVHGEGILNAAGGAVEGNERFKGALLTEADRVERLRRLRAKADALGLARRPTVFEGNASVPLDSIPPRQFQAELASPGAALIRLRAGAPMTTSAPADIELRREAGGNVLAVLRDGDGGGQGPAYGLLTAAVASAAQGSARLDVIDFLPVDDGLDAVFEPLIAARRVTLRRRRGFAPLMEELRKDVRARIEDDDMLAPARMAFLFGIHRARELDAEIGSIDADPELAEALEEVMRDGPEVGVHTWIWSDTVGGASRRLSSRMIRECGWRIAGKMSPDDSLSLLGSERAAEIRDRQLMLSNDDYGIATRAMTFGLPDAAWLARVAGGTADA